MDQINDLISQTLASLERRTKGRQLNIATSGSFRAPAAATPEALAAVFAEFADHGDSRLVEMRLRGLKFAAAMCSADAPAYWLSLVGPSGTGKTFLTKLILRIFKRHHEDRLLDENRSGPNERYLRKGGMLKWDSCIERMLSGDFGFVRQATEDWFVALDDIGAEHDRLRELSVSKLFSILNARQGKFTIITANLTVEQIGQRLDPRISSRLLRHGGDVIDTSSLPDFSVRPKHGSAAA